MDPVARKLENAEQALRRFQEILKRPVDEVTRDSAILRFALSVETAWKAARATILARSGLETLTNDRNLTLHTYEEAKANELFARLPAYAELIEIWLKAMRATPSGR